MPPNAPLNPADHQNGLSLGAYWSATVHAQWLANDKGWTGPLHTPSPNPCRTWVPPPGLENTPPRCFVCVCGWCFPEIRLGLYMFGSCHLYLFWDNMILFLFVPSWCHSYLKNKDYTRQYQVIEILLLRLMIPNSFIYQPVSQGVFQDGLTATIPELHHNLNLPKGVHVKGGFLPPHSLQRQHLGYELEQHNDSWEKNTTRFIK